MREFGRGAAALLRGFGWWRKDAAVMARGLLPAGVVAIAFAVAAVALITIAPDLAQAATPFADRWPTAVATLARIAIAIALVAGAFFAMAVGFTALTLLVGEHWYARVWQSVEASAGPVPDVAYRLRSAFVDALTLMARGIGVTLVVALASLIPVAGGAVAAAAGVVLTGWLLADELTSRALTARGIDRARRRRLLRRLRARTLGFGMATQLCFLVPFGAVAVMPAAVAGATLWVHDALRTEAAERAGI